MLFKERILHPYSNPVSPDDLRVGEVYYSVEFVDEEMLIPIMMTIVFIGRDLDPETRGTLWFQDIESYREGVTYQGGVDDRRATFWYRDEDASANVLEFEDALEVLMVCSLRRAGGSE